MRVFTRVPLGFFITSITLPAWAMLIYWAFLQFFGGVTSGTLLVARHAPSGQTRRTVVFGKGRRGSKAAVPATGMKILVVDDHVLIREALRGVIRELKGDATVLEAPNSRQAMQSIEANPDIELVLLDLHLPDRNGMEILAELRDRYPAICVVMLSASNERNDITKALDLGAQGFIPKSAQRDVMISAFNLIFAGGLYVPPEMLARRQPPPPMSASARLRPSLAADLGLTERQMDVLALMMQGKSNKVICRALDLAEPTVKNHVTAILRALKASNRTEAVIAAGALGLTPSKGSE